MFLISSSKHLFGLNQCYPAKPDSSACGNLSRISSPLMEEGPKVGVNFHLEYIPQKEFNKTHEEVKKIA